MAIRKFKVKVTGLEGMGLMTNNPQLVDPENQFTKDCSRLYLAAKKAKTPESYQASREMDIRAKMYFDPKVGVYIPGTWIRESIATASYKILGKGKSKDTMRASVFIEQQKIPLDYRGKSKVKTPLDIVGDSSFHNSMNVVQGQIRVMKSAPIYHDWSFSTDITFDDTVVTQEDLMNVLTHTSRLVGFGDWRPTYGLASAEVVS